MVGSAKVETQDGAVIISLGGEHDLATSEELGDLLERHVGVGEPVVVSVVDAEFLDCGALRVLARADRLAYERRRRRVVLHYGTSDIVRRLFEVTGFLDTIVHTRDLDEAIRLAGWSPAESWPGALGSVRPRS